MSSVLLSFYTTLLEENIKSDYFQDWALKNAITKLSSDAILHCNGMQNYCKGMSNTMFFSKELIQKGLYTSY